MTRRSDPTDGMTPETVAGPTTGPATVPMLRPPAHTPGQRAPCYSPHQFLAVTQVGTDPEDDPELWMIEEEVGRVYREGVLLLDQYFYDQKLDRFVTGDTKPHKRPDLVVRYNRALLARHVLDEVIVYLREPNGRYREICRPRVRQEALAQVDVNLAISYQKKYQGVLAKKRTKAQEAYLNQESGAEAVARLRERNLARAERQKRSKPKPVVAAPIEHARDPVDPTLQKLVDEATGSAAEDVTTEQGGGESAGTKKKRSARGSSRRKSARKSKKNLSAARKGTQRADKSENTGPTVESLLGATTGWEHETED